MPRAQIHPAIRPSGTAQASAIPAIPRSSDALQRAHSANKQASKQRVSAPKRMHVTVGGNSIVIVRSEDCVSVREGLKW